MVRLSLQKIFALLLILIIPFFILLNYSLLRSKKTVASTFVTDFIYHAPVPSEKSFVFILPIIDQNAVEEQTLSSIFGQTYENYRMILIDSSKERDAINAVYRTAHRFNKDHLISIIYNNRSKIQSLDSFYDAIQSCRNDEIIVQLSNRDWLAHETVLERINQVYNNETVWLTYCQYLEYPSLKKGAVHPFKKKTWRRSNTEKLPWLASPFKTYYAGLFKQIRKDGRFRFRTNSAENNLDLFMVPMAENSTKHIRFIDDILYVHNNPKDRAFTAM